MAERGAAPVEPAAPPDAARRPRAATNVSYLTAANLIGKAISFTFVFYATRALGTALFGNYTAVLTFVGLFELLTDLGLSPLTVLKVMPDRTLVLRYVSNVLVLRTLLSTGAILLIVGLAQLYEAPSLRSAVYVYALSLAPLAVVNTLQLVFQVQERMAYSAVLNVAASIARTVLSFLVLALGHHVLGLVVVLTVVTFLNAVVAAWLVYTRFLPLRIEVDPAWWPVLLRGGTPFALMTLLNVVYDRADVQFLYVLSGCQQRPGNAGCTPVGLYGAANRLLDVLIAIFLASLIAATLPAFKRVESESRAALMRLLQSSIRLMLAFGVPVALLVTFYAPEALHVLAGRTYMVAAPALAIMIWAFPCLLVVNMFYGAIYAVQGQSVVTAAFAVTLVFNVGLNILLIPRYSYVAPSVLTVASEVLNGFIVVIALRRRLGPLHLGLPFMKIGIVAAIVAVVLWAVHPLSIFIGLPVGIVAAVIALRLARLVGPSERAILGNVPLIGRYAALV